MTTSDLGRRLTELLHERAEDAMNDTNTQERLATVLDDGERRRRQQRRGAVAGLAAAAAVVAVAVAVANGVGDDDVVDPATTTDVDAIALAEDFLEAAYAVDLDSAEAMMAPDVSIGGSVGNDVQRWRDEFMWAGATGHSLADHSCETTSAGADETSVSCTYAVHSFGSEQLRGRPFGDNSLYLTVADGKITQVRDEWAFVTNGFNAEMWQPFKAWIRVEHPRDVKAMYSDSDLNTPRYDAGALRLWEKRVDEWVAHQL
ncbi:MAG TPA: hypothetical protein VLA70_16005 [Nocardioides sp.]|nr:hypothetical protein [Nocardioides sp.]